MKKDKKEKEVKVVGDRAKRLEDLVGSLKKNHGDGAVFYGHGPIKAEDKAVPTGSMILDASAGIGGLPSGRIVEIFGPEASGKSTLCLSIVAEAQKKGLTCAYIDTEHALDAKYARKLGVNIDNLILSQPDFAEQALDIFKEVAESGAVDVIILDSVAALVPKAELEGETADQSMGVQARMMSKMLRVLAGILNKNNCLGVFINQIRMKIGVMYGCFHKDTVVSFADGSFVPIKTVVDKKLEGPVLSWNPETKKVEEKKIINWFNNGSLDRKEGEFWMNFTVAPSCSLGEKMEFSCTPNHSIFLPDGSTAPAITFQEGDEIVSWSEESIPGEPNKKRFPRVVKILAIETSHKKGFDFSGEDSRTKYDLQIEDNACYFVGGGKSGVAVHNSPETTPGGNALKFYASMRLRVSRGETFGGEPARGHMINVKFVKNKMAPPFTECQVPLIYGQGIDQAGDLYTIAKEWGVLDVRGAHSYFNGQKFASSRDEAVSKLRSEPKVFSELDQAVRSELKKRQESGALELEEEEKEEG